MSFLRTNQRHGTARRANRLSMYHTNNSLFIGAKHGNQGLHQFHGYGWKRLYQPYQKQEFG